MVLALTIWLLISPANAADNNFDCLVQNIQHEAGAESFVGKLAVGTVTLNRVKFSKKTICEIVWEPNQFSWTINNLHPITTPNPDTLLAARLLTENLVRIDTLKDAKYFHANKSNPSWSKTKKKVATIGGHTFYSEK